MVSADFMNNPGYVSYSRVEVAAVIWGRSLRGHSFFAVYKKGIKGCPPRERPLSRHPGPPRDCNLIDCVYMKRDGSFIMEVEMIFFRKA